MRAWHDVLRRVLETGKRRSDRTGVGTLSVFGVQCEFDNSSTFPAVTTKRLAFGQVAAELACFVGGFESLEEFHSLGCRIWDGNAGAESWVHGGARFSGDLGRIYGAQWRRWRGLVDDQLVGGYKTSYVDQLAEVIDGIKKEPHSRRHVVTAWQPAELGQVCLPPCHVLFQFYVEDFVLHLRVDMRSVDLFLGLPFDVASYALLQRLVAGETALTTGRLVFQLGDAHIYLNHLEQARAVISREPLPPPLLRVDGHVDLVRDGFDPRAVSLVDYRHHGAVDAPLNV